MNYIFISPGFPQTCTYFCSRLHQNGVTVLGIGDIPYDELGEELKRSLTEYYRVSSLEDYDQVYRAVAFFIHKYGRIDWLESMNEYWLPMDARLRTDYQIAVGTRSDEISQMITKSGMKEVFLKAGIPTARQHVVKDREAGHAFVHTTGYPVIVKPDTGVGAIGAMKIHTEAELDQFYDELPPEPYVMEEFLSGDICTYDAITDSNCDVLFESSMTYAPVLDSVSKDEDICYFTTADLPQPLRELGRAAVKAFGADRRFVHFEFIHLTKDYEGIGKAGDYAIMEVNMRPAGGHDPDMMNFAQSIDIYSIYAEMVTKDRRTFPDTGEHWLCAYAARKDGHVFTHTHEEILSRYGSDLVMQMEMPEIDWPGMGRYMYMARCKSDDEMKEFFTFVLG